MDCFNQEKAGFTGLFLIVEGIYHLDKPNLKIQIFP